MALMCLFFGFLEITNGFVNVALNKPAHQLYPYRSGDDRCDASNAVDGRKSDLNLWGGQCAVSADYKQTATWWVNLTSTHSIHHITIYFLTNNATTLDFQRTYANFYLGFSLYVSKTTDMHQGTLCFKDNHFTMYTLPAVFTATCHAHGHYVIYYNERRNTYRRGFTLNVYGNLCEVEVYGCPKTGFYGSHCSVPCPDANCQYCHIETGTCQSCKPGFRGQRCENACSVGYFGQDCTEKCKSSCKGCNHVTGLCDAGCQSGWIGDFGEQECKEGKYGDKCILDCGRCRNKTKCDHVDGTCVYGCEPGYSLDYCQQPCKKGLYDVDCRESCGHCHEVSQCSNINGTCLTGCDAGYEGVLCKRPCQSGYFRQHCLERCKETCLGCNHVNGSCDSSCLPGWKGLYCQEACDEGTYGFDCNETCGHCRDVSQCSNTNGTCLNGCVASYKGDMCESREKIFGRFNLSQIDKQLDGFCDIMKD
ncbi:multiple epidermal growth factor-like domains protein 10 [Magallana gigas]|uniref:multiple epidermal growth factor-like domains protein 10 n=1 Tax=Magallana gigas TaxID=29159 RepID=UPI00333F3427